MQNVPLVVDCIRYIALHPYISVSSDLVSCNPLPCEYRDIKRVVKTAFYKVANFLNSPVDLSQVKEGMRTKLQKWPHLIPRVVPPNDCGRDPSVSGGLGEEV